MSKMSVIIRLQGLPWTASAGDIRMFFEGLNIPDGGVHIVGGERGDAFIAFTSDEDARLAMQHNNGYLQDAPVQLFLSSKTEMQNVISEARDGHIPKPVANAPPRQNIPPPMGAGQNAPRHMDNFPRQDGGERGRDNQRRPPNVSPYGSRGPREEQRFPGDAGGRGMRGDMRQHPDMPPGNFRGNRDDPRQALDPGPPGPRGRDNTHQPPNMFPPGHRGQREEGFKPDFPPGAHRDYGDEPRQQGNLPPRRPNDSPHFRGSQGPDDRLGPQQGPPGYRDSHRPQSDVQGPGPGQRGFREDHRHGPDRHHMTDHRDVRESPPNRLPADGPYPGNVNVRDGQRRPPGQRFDPNGGGPREFREEGRLGHGMPPDGPRDIRNDYPPGRRGPENQNPRNMREAPRHMADGPGSRDSRGDGRGMPPTGMRPMGDDRRHPSDPPGLNRRGYREEDRGLPDRGPSGGPLVGNMREGQRPHGPPDLGPNEFRDQDRRGPPPSQRYQEDGRLPPDRRRPDMQGPGHRPPPQRERGPPLRNGGPGGFPQDHDARITNRYDDRSERQQYSDYVESYGDKEIQYDNRPPYSDPYPSGQTAPVPDWDARRNMDAPVSARAQPTGPTPDIPRNRHRDQMGDRSYEQTENERFPPRANARTLLPDPDVPRIIPAEFEERPNERFNTNMEMDHFDGRYREEQFGNCFGKDYPGQPEMLDHRRNERGQYPPRDRGQGMSANRQMPHRPQLQHGHHPELHVRVRNMPISVTYSSLRRFFENSMIPRDGIKLLNDSQGHRIGVGFVKFLNMSGFENALSMDGKSMEGRSVNVLPCSPEDFENAVDSYTPPGRASSPKRQYSDRGFSDRGAPSPKRRRSNSPPGRRSSQVKKSRYVVLLRDIPYRASPQDLKLFFNQLEIVDNGILFDQDSSGKPNGIAFVEFRGSRDYNLALQRNNSRFMNRTINITIGDPKDYDRAIDKKRNPGGSSSSRNNSNSQSGEGGDKSAKTERIPDKTESISPKKESPQKPVNTSQINISCFCVRLKGLPPTVAKKDVEEFFKGLEIAPKGYFPVSRKDGSCTGDAFVEFLSPKECQKANAKDQQLMGNRQISVEPVSKASMMKELQELRKKAVEETQGPSQPQRPPPLYFMLGAQNLPFSVSIGEILNFFRGYNPVPESIRLHYTNEGRPTGDAVIGFMTESECHRALRDLNSRAIGRRNVRLYLA